MVKLRDGKRSLELDVRPSDAIALAVRAGKPVYVAEDVMECGGRAVPEGRQPNGRGIDAIMEELRKEVDEYRHRPRFTKAELRKGREDLIREVFE